MRDSERERDRGWAERLQRGDAAAFEGLFRAYFDPLYAFAWRYVRAPEVAEDLVQEVFLKIWQRRADWRPRRSVKAYLYGAVRNEALMHLKHQDVVRRWKEKGQQQGPPPVRTPYEELSYKEFETAIQRVIEELPERRRLIFVLHRQHELTYREIAEVLDISVKTVETQIGRALDALRKLLVFLPLFFH